MTKNLTHGFMVCMGAVALSVTALGCTPTIDGTKLEGAIKDSSSKMGITLASVTCPKDQKAAQGGTFNCDSKTSDGDTITWNVTQTDANGNVDYKSTNVMDEQKLGDQVEPQLTASAGGPIDMKCPSKWIVPKAGAKFSCDATLQGSPATVDCTFGDGTKYDCQIHH